MKKFLLLIFSLSNIGFSQIVIDKFEYAPFSNEPIAKKLQLLRSENLQSSFYIPSGNIENVRVEIDKSKIIDYFRSMIRSNFTPDIYILRGKVINSKSFNTLFDVKIELYRIENSIINTLSQDYLSEINIDKIAEYITGFVKYSLPTYYKINSYRENKVISINYGKDRLVEQGEELELVSIMNGEIAGEVSVDKVYSEYSDCDFALDDDQIDFNENTYKDYFIRVKTDNGKVKKFRNKLTELRSQRANDIISVKSEEKPEDTEYQKRKNDMFIFSVQNFFFYKYEIKQFFSIKSFTPLIIGVQWNWSKADTRFFVKGRLSLISKLNKEINNGEGSINYSSKFSFFQGGFGLQQRFPVLDYLFPGLSLCVQYMQVKIKNETTDLTNSKISTSRNFDGIDIELNGNFGLKLGILGFYVEGAYHLIPYLKDREKNDLKTSAFSCGSGITFYF